MECKLTKKLCDQIKAAGGLVQPIVAGMLGQSGWPDRLIVHPQYFGYIEFKYEGNPLTKIQYYIHRQINQRKPHSAYVCRFVKHMIDIEYMGANVKQCAFSGIELLNTLEFLSKN